MQKARITLVLLSFFSLGVVYATEKSYIPESFTNPLNLENLNKVEGGLVLHRLIWNDKGEQFHLFPGYVEKISVSTKTDSRFNVTSKIFTLKITPFNKDNAAYKRIIDASFRPEEGYISGMKVSSLGVPIIEGQMEALNQMSLAGSCLNQFKDEVWANDILGKALKYQSKNLQFSKVYGNLSVDFSITQIGGKVNIITSLMRSDVPKIGKWSRFCAFR